MFKKIKKFEIPNSDLDTEEGQKKAETLFSKTFIEYLSSKKSTSLNVGEKIRDGDQSPSVFSKEGRHSMTPSSDETTNSESSRKSSKKVKRKLKGRPSHGVLEFNSAFRNKLIQCNLIKDEEEVAPPEEVKPLLMNMTSLLQEFKQSQMESADLENLYDLISKITTLVTEFHRRPIKQIDNDKKGEHSLNLEKTVEAMIALLDEYKNGQNLDFDSGLREYKRMEKEIASKTQQIAELKKKLSTDILNHPKPSDVNLRVRNSILTNENLKSEIKFNHNQAKKYKKILLEKEWTKHKLDNELIQLKKKISKADLSDSESFDKMSGSLDLSLGREAPKKSNRQKMKSPKPKKPKEKKETKPK